MNAAELHEHINRTHGEDLLGTIGGGVVDVELGCRPVWFRLLSAPPSPFNPLHVHGNHTDGAAFWDVSPELIGSLVVKNMVSSAAHYLGHNQVW